MAITAEKKLRMRRFSSKLRFSIAIVSHFSARRVEAEVAKVAERTGGGSDRSLFTLYSSLDASSHLYKRVCPSVGPSQFHDSQ